MATQKYFRPQLELLDDRIAPAPVANQLNQGNLISALNNVAVQLERVSVLNNLTVSDVQVVNVQDVLNNNNVLNHSHFLNDIHVLQNFLNNSVNNNTVQVLNDALNNNNINVSRVVAISVLSGGDVILFTNPPA